MRATVVVVNWNGEHLLGPCLDALSRQTMPRDHWQVWVVDNASSDGSVALLERDYPWARVIRNTDNLGFAGGNNTALREVTTPFAVLLNNDATPEHHWLENVLAPFDEPGAENLAVTASKIVFMPKFVRLSLSTPGFSPGAHDSRELGVRIHGVGVDGHQSADEVLWEKLTFGPEGEGANRYRWTRPTGEMLIPVSAVGPILEKPVAIELSWASEEDKWVQLAWDGGSCALPASPDGIAVTVELPVGTPTVDVINNVGGIVLAEGYGADRGFQEVDAGQYDQAEEVFTACGNGAAIRSEVGHDIGWFDDDFFLYYEDTDLFWRIRSRGWSIRYQPSAILRHIHSASSGEWSPVFLFHVDRNRLLMLTKNATAGIAWRQVLRYPLTLLSMALREVRRAFAERRRPAVRATLMRLKIFLSYLRLMPKMLVRRRAIRRNATVDRPTLQKWLVQR